MGVVYKKWEQVLPQPQEVIWDFFSRPDNLRELTPGEVGFEMLSNLDGQPMYPGMLVEHRIRPIAGIPLYWMTEIVQVVQGQYFIDEQRFGPYAFWYHQHHFTAHPQGTLMTDHLHYRVGWGPLGTLANVFLVERMVEKIFSYRQKALADYFAKK